MGCLVRFENPSRRDFFQLFLEILRKLDRRESLPDRHLAVSLRLVARKFCGIHAEWPNVNCPWIVGANTAIGGDHAHMRSEILCVCGSSRNGSADPAFCNVHVCARTEQQAGSNSDKRFHNFSGDRLLFPKSRADRVASLMQLSCRTRGKIAGNQPVNLWRMSSCERLSFAGAVSPASSSLFR